MAWYNDVWNKTKNVGKRIGQGVGLVGPDDMIDEQGATATAQDQATQAFQAALAQQAAAQGLQQQGRDLMTYAGGLPSTADTVTAQQITGPAPIQAATADWKQTGPIERATATTAGPTRNVELGPVSTTVTGPGQIPISQASSTTAGRTVIDPLANELRGEQLDAARALITGPSAADAAMKTGLATTTEEALGLVNQARGAERGAARLQALQALATGGVKAAALGAEAKANETVARQRAFAEALSGVRGQDSATAVQQAQLDAQRNELNARLETETSRGNATAANEIRAKLVQLEQDAKTSTMKAGLDAAKAAADVSGLTADRQSMIDRLNAELQTKTSGANAQAFNDAQENNAQRYTLTSQYNAGQINKINADNVQNQIDIAGKNQQAKLTADTGNQTANLNQQKLKVGALTDALTAQQQALTAGTSAVGQGNVAAGTSAHIAGQIIGGQTAQQQAEQASQDRLVKGVATGVAAASGNPAAAAGASGAGTSKPGMSGTDDDLLPMSSTSDENAKEGVKRVSDKALLDFAARKAEGVSFDYKPGYEDSGKERHGGFPSAQMFERDPVGKLFVTRDSKGTPHIDYGNFGAMLMAAKIRDDRKRGAR